MTQRANRLEGESSPYLLQHAHNPVDWWPWGAEAFAEAQRRDVPIFLSVGYSTCYWCHVMERESFEDQRVADILNRSFVCVKVDKEERPDVDDAYMAAVQAFSGRGGWPMSVFLEPERLLPFWAGTYLPKEPRFAGVPTITQVAEGISDAWNTRREEVIKQAQELADAVRERIEAAWDPEPIGAETLRIAVESLLKMHDRTHGGFGPAPKFPQPSALELLMDVREIAGDEPTRSAIDAAVTVTLERMALGGMFDQLGGGFHRYSVDQQWIVPHFEKMLYDNAQLLSLYARAAAVYKDGLFADVARRTAAYMLREMTPESGSGGFFSAQDAEVGAREGASYVWRRDEVERILDGEDRRVALAVFGLDGAPNFRDPHHPDDEPSNVLIMAGRLEKLAERLGVDASALESRIEVIRSRLLDERRHREQPFTDDKIIASWNGLAIEAFARAGEFLGESRLVEAAVRAADFVLNNMRTGGGGLLRVRRSRGDRQARRIPGFLEDWAMLASGTLELARITGEAKWKDVTASLLDGAESRFTRQDGGYQDVPREEEEAGSNGGVFVTSSSLFDGAMPSGWAVMLHNWVRWDTLTGQKEGVQRATRGLAAASGFLARAPAAAPHALRALIAVLRADREAFRGAVPERASRGDGRSLDREAEDVVAIYSAAERVRVTQDAPSGLVLRVQIADGYHVNAAEPGVEGVAGFRVFAVNGTGVNVYAQYPEGEPCGEGGLRVYRGMFELPVMIERSGDWSGNPLLAVAFQVCRDDACLPPRVVELDVAIDRGA